MTVLKQLAENRSLKRFTKEIMQSIQNQSQCLSLEQIPGGRAGFSPICAFVWRQDAFV